MFSQRERRLPASAVEKSVATASLFIGIAIWALGGGDGTFKPTSACSDRGAGAVILRFSGAVPSVEDTCKSLSSVKSTATRFGLSLVFVSSIMSSLSHIVYGNRVLYFLRFAKMILQRWESAIRKVLKFWITPGTRFFLKCANVFFMIFHHALDISAIELHTLKLGKAIIQGLFFLGHIFRKLNAFFARNLPQVIAGFGMVGDHLFAERLNCIGVSFLQSKVPQSYFGHSAGGGLGGKVMVLGWVYCRLRGRLACTENHEAKDQQNCVFPKKRFCGNSVLH